MSCDPNPNPNVSSRRGDAERIRERAFDSDNPDPYPRHQNNCDERPAGASAPNPNVSFAKALKRRGADVSDRGEPDPSAFSNTLAALGRRGSTAFNAFESLATSPAGSPDLPAPPPRGLKLTNPMGGLTFDIQCPDTHAITVRPSPSFGSPETAAEMAELYWMALLRDLTFSRFTTHTVNGANADDALADLNRYPFFRDFFGPNDSFTLEHLFRAALIGNKNAFRGVVEGPHVSQFLVRGTPEVIVNPDGTMQEVIPASAGTVAVGTLRVSQRQRTVQLSSDFMTDPVRWRDVQRGVNMSGRDRLDLASLRFIRNMRDLANYVHFDKIYQEYYVAACILLTLVPRTGARFNAAGEISHQEKFVQSSPEEVVGNVPVEFQPPTLDVLNPANPYRRSRAQNGFTTFGATHILTGLAEVSTRAHRAVFFQKWHVHRRLRPEEFGGRVHFELRHTGTPPGYGIHQSLLESAVPPASGQPPGILRRIEERFGSYLLPQVFPEGCPTHPAYPAAHATLAGAAVTMLKAFFDEEFEFEESYEVVPGAGTSLSVYEGPRQLKVGGELNKLASNIAFGRGMAGVHWRSDNIAGLLQGEQIAIGLLMEQSLGLPEHPDQPAVPYYTFRKFDGTSVEISNGTCRVTSGAGFCFAHTVDWK